MNKVIFWKEFHKEQFNDPPSFTVSLVKQAAFPSSATLSSLLAQDFVLYLPARYLLTHLSSSQPKNTSQTSTLLAKVPFQPNQSQT